jgi:glycosyltransferase involved in cell wall biosynthesis
MLSVALVTVGDPATLTGGYLYHRRVAALAEANDARVRFISFPAWPFPAPLMRCRQIRRMALRYEVVLLDSIAAAYTAPAPLGRHQPVAAIVHQPPGGIDHGPLRARWQAALDLRGYIGVRRFLAASHSIAQDLHRRGIGEDRVRVLPPGTQPPTPPSGSPGELRRGRRMALLSVGNWVPRKGLLDLLAAVAQLPEPTLTLHLAGDTDLDAGYRDRIRACLATPELADRVVVHGAVSPQRVSTLYSAADAFALTSYVEPYGTVYAEAMAAGLPVVGWRAGNLPNLARDGIEGYILDPGDVDGLAAALLRLSDDPPARQGMANAARHRAQTLPTWEETARELYAELRALAD